MPLPQERVAAAMQYFFQQALPQATGKSFAQLSNPKVHVGAYVRYTGAPVATSMGQAVTPAYALRISPPLPLANGLPNPAGMTPPTTGPLWPIVWVRQVADAGVDDEAELRRVMADIDSFAQLFGPAAAGPAPAGAPAAGTSEAAPSPSVPGSPPVSPELLGPAAAPPAPAPPASLNAAVWARGIAASRQALAANLSSLTQLPQALAAAAGDLASLKHVLQHFCTYTADGAYYRRWSGAGRDPLNASHLTPEYKQNNVLEVLLQRGVTYLYAVVPESLLNGGADLGQGFFREIVLRFDESGAPGALKISTLHTAQWRLAAAPHEDFVFLHAEEGTGVPAPREVTDKLSPRLQAFVLEVASTAAADLPQLYAKNPFMVTQPSPQAHLLGVVEGSDPTWPDGVAVSTDGPIRSLLVPPDKILTVAALSNVTHLTTVPPTTPSLEIARAKVHYPQLDTKIVATKRGGEGVLVGVIDTGVDGSHPAFAGRLVAVWDQGTPPAVAGNPPATRHPGNQAYKDFTWGTELQGAETANSLDPGGHGTHVTGIVAGAEVRSAAGDLVCPAGLAPKAKIVVVRSIGIQNGSDPTKAVKYIFQKAQELSLPCVINMSFGTNDHAHDASDTMSLGMFQEVWQTSSQTYKPGRILVAAAGNERGLGGHVFRQAPAGPGAQLSVPVNVSSHPPWDPVNHPGNFEHVLFWIKNPGPAHPAAFPLDLQVFRQANPLATTPLVRVGQHTAGWITFPGLQTRIRIASKLWDPTNGDMSFIVEFISTGSFVLPPNTWVCRFVNGFGQALEIHGWVTLGWRAVSQFAGATAADESFLVGSPADSPGVISVASVNSRLTWRKFGGTADSTTAGFGTLDELSSFSSPGPIRAAAMALQTMYHNFEDVRAIDTAAPGCRIQSALSKQANPPPPAGDIITRDPATPAGTARSFLDQGTSMASPVIAGLVANVLATNDKLDMLEVTKRLRDASEIPTTSKFQAPATTVGGLKPWSQDWGYGLVDANKLRLG